MDHEHWLLVILWVGYCLLHSFLASVTVKNGIGHLMGSRSIYYRPLYSIFAFVSMVAILWFQFNLISTRLFNSSYLVLLPGALAVMAGCTIMIMCINTYFYELSGMQAIQQPGVKNTLQQSGLHKYIRHPLYLGTLLFIWGLFFIFPFLNNLLAVTVITAYVWIGIRLEERKLQLEYGNSYNEYAKKVPKLIPHFYPIKKGSV